jgi:hypothetical protein
MNLDKSNSATLEGTDKIVISRQGISEYTCTLEKLSDYVESNIPAPTPSTPPYKSYIALITQTGTNVPTANILENTFGAVPTFSRTNYGVGAWYYTLTLANAFPANKTFVQSSAYGYNYISNFGDSRQFTFNRVDNSTFEIFDSSGADGQLLNVPIEIRVYN